MKFNITESEKNTIREMYGLVTEAVNVGGRSATINPDGTVSITDKSGRPQKIRMSINLMGKEVNINVANIQPTNGGYNIKGQSGNTEFVDNNKINKVVQFVDTNSPSVIESGSWSTPNLNLRKV